MRNLLETKSGWFPAASTRHHDLPLSAATWDNECGGFICAFGPSKERSVIEVTRVKDGMVETIATWNHPYQAGSSSEPEKILNITYFSDSRTICLTFSYGDLVLVREDSNPEQGGVEIVGTVDGGIECALWSPDEEMVAILSTKHHFVLMSRYFEEISDTVIASDDLHMSKHVNVGWGNSATQFKGKRAAAMRDPTVPEKIDKGLLSTNDNGESKLSWRGDGAFVALSTVDQGSRRMIRVFGRSGELESVSEPVDFLSGPLTWKPSGSLIASIQYLKDENAQVVFFERNGLRHGNFSLSENFNESDQCIIIDIVWNSDSSVLAICTINKIQLWTTNNYHWYLKKEIKSEFPIKSIFWHPDDHLTIAYCGTGAIYFHSFAWSTSIGAVNPPNDYGQIAVVDGKILKLTPLRLANVPPPFALHEITLSSTPSDVAFSKDGKLVAILYNSSVEIISWNLSVDSDDTKPQLLIGDRNFIDCKKARQVCFQSEDELLILYGNGEPGSKVTRFKIGRGAGGSSSVIEHKTPKSILRLLSDPNDSSVLYEDIDGCITDFDGTCQPIKLPEPCPWIHISRKDNTEKTVVFGLSESGKLYANSRLLSSGCTSFLATSDYLAFTVSSHILKFVHLVKDVEDLEVPSNDPSTDERCRSIERGSRIVHICPSTFAVILQMPRGNLETIFPRILVLAGIRRCIDELDYASAFRICRTHRVDLNILCDYKPDQFMGNIYRFIADLNNASYLDLFLSQIRNEDISNKIYRQTAPGPQSSGLDGSQIVSLAHKSIKNKVNNICNAFLGTLRERPTDYVQTIITAHVCKEPPDFDSALKLISGIHGGDVKSSESPIEHIIFLSDAAKLYDHALGIYDIDLALVIAEKSQKDPREYLPFLQSLKEMPTERRKYTVDDILGRYPKALEHLSLCDEDTSDEFKNYMIKHKLYQTALELYRSNNQKRNEIMLMYATYLNEGSKFKEAAIAFEFLDQYQMATEAYRKAGLWQQAIYSATRAGQSDDDVRSIAESFAESLYETKDYQSAAKLYLDYLDNVEFALKALCKGYYFEEALRIAVSKQRLNYIEEIIDAELIEAFNGTTEFIVDCREQISAQLRRLQELRQRKIDEPLSYFDGQIEEDAPDNVSLAITNASTFGGSIYTRYTGKTRASLETTATRRTEKNRRRQDRKKAKGKKGTIYETEYLLASIKRLMHRIERAQGDSSKLVEALMRRRMKERAESIQHGVEDILLTLRNSRPDVLEQMSEAFMLSRDGLQDQDSVESSASLPVVSQFDSLSILCPFHTPSELATNY